MHKNQKVLLFSRYSFRDVLSSISRLNDRDLVVFMPKIPYPLPYISPTNLKKKFVRIIIYIFNRNISIEEIPFDSIAEHCWSSNMEAVLYLFARKNKLARQRPVKFLDSVLKDSNVVNYFQASLVSEYAYQILFSKIINDYKKITSNLYWVGRVIDNKQDSQKQRNLFLLDFLKKISYFFDTFKYLTITFFLPFYFLFKNLSHGFILKPKQIRPLVTVPVVLGVTGFKESSNDFISSIRGVKSFSDDTFIYGDQIKKGDVVHVFDLWRFDSNKKKNLINTMRDRNYPYLDSDGYKMNIGSLAYIFLIAKKILKHSFVLLKDFNKLECRLMVMSLPKGIQHILKKHLELQYIIPKVDLIRHDYNPGSILSAIVCKNHNIKTVGISHHACPYDCPQLSFINYDRYLLFGNLQRKLFKTFLKNTNIVINGSNLLDPVIRLKTDLHRQKVISKRYIDCFGERKNKILIILPGDARGVREFMRQRMLNALEKWISNPRDNNTSLIIRFRKKSNINEIPEWRDIYKLAENNKEIIVDFNEFTTQELIFLSDIVVVPHTSFSMTESLALEKVVFSFDFLGSAAVYFKGYGPDLIITEEKKLYDILSGNIKDLDSLDTNYQKLTNDLDSHYDGNNAARLQQLIVNI